MKKTLVSIAAVAALSTGAMAADKGIDLVTTGQAVVYYETKATDAPNDAGFFDQANSIANVGVQLNVGGDLGNNFTLGTQLSYLGTLGLENNLVVNTRLDTAQSLNGTTTSELMLTKIFVAKKIANTTVKLGRQELPKSLSPFAYSEGWNVFKNTFDAALVVNTDVPDTTIVGAYVSGANTTFNGANKGDLVNMTSLEAYMLTVANKSIPMTTLTASYYSISNADKTVMWVDAKIKDKALPMGLCVGIQGGAISVDGAPDDTTAFGIKVAVKPMKPLMVQLAYTSVSEDGVGAVKNATGVKSPLYTQAIYNQNAISANGANTIGLKTAYNMGDAGKIIAIYNMTTNDNATDYNEFDLIYRIKSGGVSYWASAMLRDMDGFADNKLRVWARYAF